MRNRGSSWQRQGSCLQPVECCHGRCPQLWSQNFNRWPKCTDRYIYNWIKECYRQGSIGAKDSLVYVTTKAWRLVAVCFVVTQSGDTHVPLCYIKAHVCHQTESQRNRLIICISRRLHTTVKMSEFTAGQMLLQTENLLVAKLKLKVEAEKGYNGREFRYLMLASSSSQKSRQNSTYRYLKDLLLLKQ